MKNFMTLALLLSFVSFSAFAEGEATTECPMMRESNQRSNPKVNKEKSEGVKFEVKPTVREQ